MVKHSSVLPSIDGNIVSKVEAKSTARHKRETMYKIAEKLDLSEATLRRGHYIQKFGSAEINELCRSGKLSIWKAYNIVKKDQERKTVEYLFSLPKEEVKGLYV